MPILRITSLPFENQDSGSWAVEVCQHFAASTEIPLQHVSAIWQLLPNKHYAHGGNVAYFQPRDSHPVIVDVLLPDFYALDSVENIIMASVDAVCHVSLLPANNVFVQVNRARSGAVFDEGQIVRW